LSSGFDKIISTKYFKRVMDRSGTVLMGKSLDTDLNGSAEIVLKKELSNEKPKN